MMRFLILIAVFLGLGFASQSRAAGFYIQEQSVSGLGTAFAGAVADTPDASTIYYNPAGMADLEKAEVSLGTHIIIPNTSFKNSGSTVSSTVGTGGASATLSGGDGGNPYDPAVVPNAYLAFPVNEDQSVWVGVGISAPFGLTNEHEDSFFGRYDSTENSLTTINVAPSLAWAVSEWLSVGLGIDIQHADAKLENAVPSPITAGGPVPETDGLTDLSGHDLTTGFNAGVIIKPYPGTRIGAHYRQGISHTLEGRVITRLPSDIPAIGGTFTKADVSAELDLPNIATIGFSQEITDKIKVLGHVIWFEWSNFDDIPILTGAGNFSQSLQNYKNTMSVALGAQYQIRDDLSLKIGMQYEETPTQDGFRSTRIPDGDRIWVALGATYDINESWALDLSGAYINIEEEDINLTGTSTIGAASTTYNISGSMEGEVGIVSAALRYKFGVD